MDKDKTFTLYPSHSVWKLEVDFIDRSESNASRSANQSTKLAYNLVYGPRSKNRRTPRTGITDTGCWPRSSFDWRGQGYWAAVLAPWALVGGLK